MLRSALIAGLFLVTPVFVLAQAPKVPDIEVFGGVSYLNVAGYEGREHFSNAATGVTMNVNKYFGLFGEAGLPIAGPSETFPSLIGGFPIRPPFTFGFRDSTKVSTALFGPRFSLRRERTTLFVHGLAGVVRTTNKSEHSLVTGIGLPVDPLSLSSSFAVHTFAYGFGGGVDVNVNHRFAIRVLQADYLRARIEGTGNQLRLQSGVVVRFGEQSH